MVNSKSKGASGEREAAKLIGGHKISRSRQTGPDLCDCTTGKCKTYPQQTNIQQDIHYGKFVEVKRPKKLPKQIVHYLDQMVEEGADYLLVREDRGKWVKIQYV